jgi:hypothetical protein
MCVGGFQLLEVRENKMEKTPDSHLGGFSCVAKHEEGR